MTLITKELFLKKHKLKNQKVTINGDDYLLQEMSGIDRDLLELYSIVGKTISLENLRAKVVILSLIDENGKKIFDIEKDSEIVGNLSGKVIVELYKIAKELSGLGESEVEELAKNSETSGKKDDSSLD